MRPITATGVTKGATLLTLSPARRPVPPALPKPAPDGAEGLETAGPVQGAAPSNTRVHVAAMFLAIHVGYGNVARRPPFGRKLLIAY